MIKYITKRYNEILIKLNLIEGLAFRLAAIIVCIFLLSVFLMPGITAFADGSTGGSTDDAAMTFIDIFNDLGQLAIKVCYALMFIVFAVGTVKAGLGAQAAQAFGATGRVSMEMLNLVGGIIIFVIGLMTLPIVNTIIDSVSTKLAVDSNIGTISNPVIR
ncbi:MAG: hypothetical protein P8Z42_00850 [Anaerolineales bacterium]